jgi:hypothetical protein
MKEGDIVTIYFIWWKGPICALMSGGGAENKPYLNCSQCSEAAVLDQISNIL